MTVDFSQSRAAMPRTDPSRVISGILQTGQSVANSELQGRLALGQGIQQGAENFAHNYAIQHSPQKKVADAAAAEKMREIEQQQGADKMRAGSSLSTIADAAAADVGHPIDQEAAARAAATAEWGVPFEQLPPMAQTAARNIIGTIGQQPVRIRPGSPDDVRTLGKFGDPDYVGVTAGEATKAGLAQTKELFRKEAVANPYVRAALEERAQTQMAAQRVRAQGDIAGAEIITERGDDPRLTQKLDAFRQRWDDMAPQAWTMPDGSTRLATLRDVASDGLLSDPAFVEKNRGETRNAAPGIALTQSADGKTAYHPQVDDDVVRNFVDKKSDEAKIAQRYVGRSTDELNAALVGFRASRDAVDAELSKPGALPPNASPSAVGANAAWNTIRAKVAAGDVSKDVVAAIVAKRAGLGDIDAADFAGGQAMLDPNALREVDRLVTQAMQDPEAAKRIAPGSGGEFDKRLARQYQSSMQRGMFPSRAGPLGWTTAAGYATSDVSDFGRRYSDAEARKPEYGYFRAQLAAIPGVSDGDGERYARQLFPRFEAQLDRERNSRTWGGKRYAELTDAERLAVSKGIADRLVGDLTGYVGSGLDAANALAKEGGRPGLATDSRAVAKSVRSIEDAMRDAGADVPDTYEHELPDGSKIAVRAGQAETIKPKGGAPVSLAPRTGDSKANEAWKTSARMAIETTAGDEWGGAVAAASVGASDPLVRNLVDGEFAARIHGMLRSPGAADGASLRAYLETWMSRNGVRATDLREALNNEWTTGANPVIGALTGFVENVLSPQPTTRADLDAINGKAPTKATLDAARKADEQPAGSLADSIMQAMGGAASRPDQYTDSVGATMEGEEPWQAAIRRRDTSNGSNVGAHARDALIFTGDMVRKGMEWAGDKATNLGPIPVDLKQLPTRNRDPEAMRRLVRAYAGKD